MAQTQNSPKGPKGPKGSLQKVVSEKPTFLLAISEEVQLMDWLKKNGDAMGFCMAGRSNVGKSSLINSLFGLGTARTSKTPGRTREVLIFSCKYQAHVPGTDQLQEIPFFLIDLPGYGYAEVSKMMAKKWHILLGMFFEYLPENMMTLNIQDARHPDQATDQDFYQYLKAYTLPSYLILNKMDKLKTQKERAQLEKEKISLFKKYKKMKQIYFVSAETGNGLEALTLGLGNFLDQSYLKSQGAPAMTEGYGVRDGDGDGDAD